MYLQGVWSPLLVIIALLFCTMMVSGIKHLVFDETCGGDDTCDKNKGLYCDIEKKICQCSEAASWIKDIGEDFQCRVMAGKKCGRTLTSPKCEKGMYCEAVKEGELAETICKCPPENETCIEGRRGQGQGASSFGPCYISIAFGYLVLARF